MKILTTMKNIIIFILVTIMLSLVSCDYLDYTEEDFYGEEEFFTSFDRTKLFLNGIYGQLPSGFNEINGSMRASASDDAVEANSLSSIYIMNDDRWSPVNTVDDVWGDMYGGIRSVNIFLKNLDISVLEVQRYNEDYPELVQQYELFDEQARFLRAYFYFELARRYGGVPLLNGAVLDLEDVNEVTKNTFDQVIDFIVEECDAIFSDLPTEYTDIGGPNEGRVTKGAALALKARALLYAASPLHGSAQEKWEAAAAAAFTVIDSGWYSLESNYSDIVNNPTSTELIFGRRFTSTNDFEAANFPVGYEGAQPGTCPTQNLVNTYEMDNGMDIDEAGSGYDPQNPYENRDPRLSQTIIVNNSMWKDRNVEIWQGGRDGPPLNFSTRTGYYLKKYVVELVSLDPDFTTTANHVWVFFRYGEILLNFAEAMNEAYGPASDPEGYGMTALDALNMVRNRTGIPDYAGAMTVDDVREQIRDERRVELAFENHRFWDLRRWQIGEQTNEIMGMKITQVDNTFSYTEVVVETRPWSDKRYFYPIAQSELYKNPNLTQNTGWN